MDYSKYCCGCGLCVSENKATFQKNVRGFNVIAECDSEGHDFYEKVCPASGIQCNKMDKNFIWGKQKGVYLAYSSDEEVRYTASSGGVLTGLCNYLLDYNMVDGIIHTGEDPKMPISTVTLCSTTKEEVMRGCGSRYSSSAPLLEIQKYLNSDKKYAFIGKPCDVTVLRNYAEIDKRVNEHFPYMFSFFCAGAPSERANKELLEKMGCELERCSSLKYRGDGWPGYATAIDVNGETYKLPYRTAWRDTLGRDIRLICRVCLDGIGELADISCADAWYLDENKLPKFDEAEGRNVVFCRTEVGLKLYMDACRTGYLVSENYDYYEEDIKCYQKYQFVRRAGMRSMLFAMKLTGKKYPKYDKRLLKNYEKHLDLKIRIKRFLGTFRRLLEGKFGYDFMK